MLRTLNELFRTLLEPPPADNPVPAEHMLQLATAVLLVEMMRIDAHSGAEERRAVLDALREKFDLAEDELARLFELAQNESREASDFYGFTSQLNKGYTPEQKLRIVEYLWQVALADGHLSHHENHLMRKLVDLLHIPHADNVAAKQRARDRTGHHATHNT
jgi:uncharacterized tellurite resistance protein B-like protein